jgi:hypothetical protein
MNMRLSRLFLAAICFVVSAMAEKGEASAALVKQIKEAV